MTPSGTKQLSRSVETQIEIDAPLERVWEALTEADELARWFPPEARVTPGPGGSIEMFWGENGTVWESRVDVWEPHRRLRTTGVPRPANDSSASDATPLVLDYFLEARGGKTVVRLVHSGVGSGADWADEYYESFRRGWDFELRGLRHYLERHRGQRRLVAWARFEFEIPFDEAWARLMGPRGFLRDGSLEGLEEGDRYSITAANGDAFTGIVQVNEPLRQFSGTVENTNDSLLRVKLDPAPEGGEATVWLSTYRVSRDEVDAFQWRWSDILRQLLG